MNPMPSLSDETNGALAALEPGMTIGIVGGGQLGRMMALSAKYMGFRVGVLDPTDDCPTAQVADFQIVADYDDTAAIRALADHSDVLTYEFENVDADALDAVRDRVAIPQGTDLLRVTQNRIAEKTFINDHGIGTAPWRAVQSRDELDAALAEIGYPAVLKTSEGGYDGHGQIVLHSEDDLAQVWAADEFPQAILEGFVDFAYEASILVSGDGEHYVTFPVVRNIHPAWLLSASCMYMPSVSPGRFRFRALSAWAFRSSRLRPWLLVLKNIRLCIPVLALSVSHAKSLACLPAFIEAGILMLMPKRCLISFCLSGFCGTTVARCRSSDVSKRLLSFPPSSLWRSCSADCACM